MIRYHAQWVVPISAPPLRDGTVAVDGGRIVHVGERAGAPPGDDVDLGRVILCPGLVNTHCHLELTAMRGFLEGLSFPDWILRLTTAKRTVLSRRDLLDSARWGVIEGLRSGITTYADTCDSGVAFDAMRELGVRGIMYQEVFGPDPAQAGRSMQELRAKIDALRSRETALVKAGVSPHAPYTVSDELLAAVAAYAQSDALPVAVHVAEGAAECDLVTGAGGIFADGLRSRGISTGRRARSPIDLLERCGLLATRPLLVHAVHADDDDIELLRTRNAAVAHCPISNAKLGHGVAPLMRYLAAGVRVGVGSDSVASNNRMDLLEEVRVAALMQGAVTRRADALPAAQALRLATLGGAEALGLEREIGSLEPGKAADLAAFSISGPSAVPVQEPEAALVHAIRGCEVAFVSVAGLPLLPHLPGLAAAVEPRIHDIGARLQDWLRRVEAIGGPVPPFSATR